MLTELKSYIQNNGWLSKAEFNLYIANVFKKKTIPSENTIRNFHQEVEVTDIIDSASRGGYYFPMRDQIKLYNFHQLATLQAENMIIHELAHATGHESRLNRPSLNNVVKLWKMGIPIDTPLHEEMVAQCTTYLYLSTKNTINQEEKKQLYHQTMNYPLFMISETKEKGRLSLDKIDFDLLEKDISQALNYLEENIR